MAGAYLAGEFPCQVSLSVHSLPVKKDERRGKYRPWHRNYSTMVQAKLLRTEAKTLDIDRPLRLEGGGILPDVSVRYTIAGQMDSRRSNIVWFFHALTGNSNPLEWWPRMFEPGGVFDPDKYCIVCANILGSCYGTTGPRDFSFPSITIRDMVAAHKLLRDELEIDRVQIGAGGSLGGHQLLEWAVQEPDFFESIIAIATSAQHSPWGIAFNEVQRMAIRDLDKENGIRVARALAVLSYRNYSTFELTQKEDDRPSSKFRASSYMQHQGDKIKKRFTPESYYYLTQAMDSHDVGRSFSSPADALGRIKSSALVLGISSDILFPLQEQEFIANHIPDARFGVIESDYGHDGFLLEMDEVNSQIRAFLEERRFP